MSAAVNTESDSSVWVGRKGGLAFVIEVGAQSFIFNG